MTTPARWSAPFVIFHGTELPPRRWAAGVTADVVLQPYHPLVAEGRFGDYFPQARRWIYTNPTAIDPERQRHIPKRLILRDPGDRWQLTRMRLPEGLDLVLEDAAELAGRPGVHGLFLDDLDRLIARGDEVLSAYLSGLAERISCPVFVNRGFAALARVPRLAAVLVEDLSRDLASPGSYSWVQSEVLPALAQARDAGCRLHRIDYEPALPYLPPTARLLDRAVSRLCDHEHRVYDEQLVEWREWA